MSASIMQNPRAWSGVRALVTAPVKSAPNARMALAEAIEELHQSEDRTPHSPYHDDWPQIRHAGKSHR